MTGKGESVVLTALVNWGSRLDLSASWLPSTVSRTGCVPSCSPSPTHTLWPESFPELVIFPFRRGQNEPEERVLICKYKVTLLAYIIRKKMTLRFNTVAGALHADIKIGL